MQHWKVGKAKYANTIVCILYIFDVQLVKWIAYGQLNLPNTPMANVRSTEMPVKLLIESKQYYSLD